MLKRRQSAVIVFIAAVLAIAGCTRRGDDVSQGTPQPSEESHQPSQAETIPAPEEPDPIEDVSEDTTPPAEMADTSQPTVQEVAGQTYIDLVVQDTIAKFVEPGMSEYEKAKAAFDYMIENTHLVDPVGLDLWRIRGDGNPMPSYVENRSLSVMLYGIGMCEDYAAAMTMLLRGMGIEAEYVPGLTYSTQGALVDHAWCIAKIDGVWYHLDCQLEDNISRHGSIRYKYFMRSDATMAGSHRWGQNLIDSRLLTAQQNEEIAQNYLFPPCPQDYPTPARRSLAEPPMPDVNAIKAAIEAEFQEYEQANGPLEPLEINVIPPVFALEGYGPQE